MYTTGNNYHNYFHKEDPTYYESRTLYNQLRTAQIKSENEQFQLTITREIMDGSQIELPHALKSLIYDMKHQMYTQGEIRNSLFIAEEELLCEKETLKIREEIYQSAETQSSINQKQCSAAQKTLVDLENQLAEATTELPKVTDQLLDTQARINDHQLVLASITNQVLVNRAAADAAQTAWDAAKEQLWQDISARKKPQEDYVKARYFPGDAMIEDTTMKALTDNYNKLHAQVVKGRKLVPEAQELSTTTRNTLIASEAKQAAKQAELIQEQSTLQELQNRLQEIQNIIANAPAAIPEAKKAYETIESQLREDEKSLLIAKKELEKQKKKVASCNTSFLGKQKKFAEAIAKIEENKNKILQLQIESQESTKAEIQNLKTQLLQKENNIEDLKTKGEYAQFANVIRPIVALAAGAISFYVLINNPIMVYNNTYLFCRTVNIDITIRTLDILFNIYAMEKIVIAIGSLAAYASAYLFAPAILYSVLKFTNAIIKTPIYLLNTAYAYRKLLLLLIITGLTYCNPSLANRFCDILQYSLNNFQALLSNIT